MFSNCILRQEDGYQCPGKSPENCEDCTYYYEGTFLTDLIGTALWTLIGRGFLLACIIALPLLLTAGIIEVVR